MSAPRAFDPDHCTACGDFLPCGESWIETTEVEAALYYANREIERIRGERDMALRMHEVQWERANRLEEERALLGAHWAKVEALFAGGPDTPCRTTYPDGVECVEVPMDDLRAALDGA